MKLYYIVNLRMPTERAHGYQIAKMCEQFSLANIEVELLVPRRKNLIKDDIWAYYSLEKKFKIRYVKIFDFFILSKLINPRICYWLNTLFFTVSVIFLKKKEKKSIIYSRSPEIVFIFKILGHKVFFDAHYWPEKKHRYFKCLLRKVDGIICNSNGTAEVFKNNGFKNILVAPNGVELKDFVTKKNNVELREELGLPKNKEIIMYIGHLYEWKGVKTILKTAKLMGNLEEILFMIVGGTINDLAKYRKIISEEKITNIVFIGHKDRKSVSKYLLAADVLLLPNAPVGNESKYYTSPIKMFEYMASARPIIASDLPSIKEVLDDNNCIFFEAGNHEDLKAKISLSLSDHELSARISKQARIDVEQYSWGNRAKKIVEFINIFQ